MLTYGNGSRGRVLARLKASRDPQSGESLSADLGISRVAVWGHVQSLLALGYPIETGRRGYLLAAATDLLLPWEVPGFSRRIAWIAETDSTMDEARRLAVRGAAGAPVIVAERQTRGRGRNGRRWSSASGGIYATFLRRDAYPAALVPRITLAAALAVADSLERVCGVRPALKWPNDVLLGGRKVAGVLVEADTRADRLRWFSIGVGINVRNSTGVAGAGSVEQAAGRRVERAALLAAVCRELDRRLAGAADAPLTEEWNRRSSTRGRTVEVSTVLGRVRGRATGVDEWGALVVRRADGALLHVPSGDCVHAKEAP